MQDCTLASLSGSATPAGLLLALCYE